MALRMKRFILVLCAAVAFSGAVLAVTPDPDGTVTPRFHPWKNPPVPRRDPGQGIYSHQVFSARSKDGLHWQKDGKLLFDHASVPDAVIMPDGTIYLYFMDGSQGHGMSVAISRDLGRSWTKDTVAISGRQEPGDAVDPNPLLTADGQIRMFYLGTFGPMQDPSHGSRMHNIRSALSADGIHFGEEPGVRFAHQGITDPDVIQAPSGWKMFVSQGRTNLSTSSPDSQAFTLDDTPASRDGAVSRTVAMDGGFRMYRCSQGGGIASQFTSDFKTWKEEGVVLPAERETITCDPGVIRLPDGTYVMFYKQAPMRSGHP